MEEDDVLKALGIDDDEDSQPENEENVSEQEDIETPSDEDDTEHDLSEDNPDSDDESDEPGFEFDVPEDILEDDELEESPSDRQHALLQYLDRTVEIDGIPVDLTNIEMLDKIVERGINSIKQRDLEDVETHALISLKENGIELQSEKMDLIVATLKGDESAAAKLISTAGLDIDNIADLVGGYDNEKILNYKPPSYMLDKNTYNMHKLLNEMYQDEAGKKAIEYINNWDDTSKQHAANHPQLIYAVREMFRQGKDVEIAQQIKKDAIFSREAIGNYDYIRFMNASDKLINNTIQQMESATKKQAIKTRIPKTFRNKFDYKTKKVRITNEDIMSMTDEEFQEYYEKYVVPNRK